MKNMLAWINFWFCFVVQCDWPREDIAASFYGQLTSHYFYGTL